MTLVEFMDRLDALIDAVHTLDRARAERAQSDRRDWDHADRLDAAVEERRAEVRELRSQLIHCFDTKNESEQWRQLAWRWCFEAYDWKVRSHSYFNELRDRFGVVGELRSGLASLEARARELYEQARKL